MSTSPSSNKNMMIALSSIGLLFFFICACFIIVLAVRSHNKQQAQRQQELSNAISVEETNHYLYWGFYIPVTDQNVEILMQRIGAKKNDRSFVVAEMNTWTGTLIPPGGDDFVIPTIPYVDPGIECFAIYQRCNSSCRSMFTLDDEDIAKQSSCFDDCNASKASCESGQP